MKQLIIFQIMKWLLNLLSRSHGRINGIYVFKNTLIKKKKYLYLKFENLKN